MTTLGLDSHLINTSALERAIVQPRLALVTSLACLLLVMRSDVWGEPPEAKLARADRYDDPLPDGALARLGTVRWRHRRAEWVVYARDGKSIYSAGLDLRKWDATTGRELRRWNLNLEDNLTGLQDCILDTEHMKLIEFDGTAILLRDIHNKIAPLTIKDDRENMESATLSPDGKLLASRCYGDGSARLWDAATGRELRRLGKIETTDIKGRLAMNHSLAFSPDGKLLAVANEEGIVRIRDVATGEVRRRVRESSKHLNHLVFSPDGKTLAWKSDGKLCLWDAIRGGEPRRIKAFGEQEGIGYDLPFAFSPDNRVLASGQDDGTIHFWQIANGRELRRTPPQPSPVAALAFSPDGREVVAALDNALRFWDVTTGAERRLVTGHAGVVASATFSLDGKTVLTSGFDKTVRVWDASGRQRHCSTMDQEQPSPAAFSPDGRRFAYTGRDRAIHVGDTDTGRELGRSPPAPFGWPGDAVFIASNTKVAFNEHHSPLRLWDMDTGKVHLRPLPGADDPLGWGSSMYFSRDGSRLAVSRSDRVYLLEPATGREFSSFKRSIYSAVAFAPDGRSLITVEWEQLGSPFNGTGPGRQSLTFRVREVATGQERCQFKSPPTESIDGLAISPDGRLVAFGGGREHSIYLWELATGKQVGRLCGRDHSISALAFSPDGRTLASASGDTTVLLWDVAAVAKAAADRSSPLSAQELEKLGARLASDKAAVAYQAMVCLTASPKQSVPFLRDRLRPIAVADARCVHRLFADLDSVEFTVRDTAAHELDRLGERASPILRELLAGKPSLEVRKRVETLLEKWENQPLPLETIRAVEVLEQIGNSEARKALESIAAGAAGSRLTREAKASLRRLSNQ